MAAIELLQMEITREERIRSRFERKKEREEEEAWIVLCLLVILVFV